MITVFDKKQDCCGCTACKSSCPTQAIKMKADEEGFLYPEVNQKLCVDCKLCRKVCPLQNQINVQDRFTEPLVYALKHKSDNVRMTSASGGAYTAISDYALSTSCTLYGVEFSGEFIVQHKGAITEAGRNKFKGSKYVQSNLGETFKQVYEDLATNKAVFFSGTPCEVAGLRKYMEISKVKTDKLILNDIICHGTPSPLLWKKYLNFIQKKKKLKSYTFRAKEKGWHGCNVKAEFENGKSKINTPDVKIYANIFESNLALRQSCYHCRFSNLHRPSDITIGDFWGIEKSLPELDDDKGISLIFVNTPKGQSIFNHMKNKIDFVQSNTNDCLQPNLERPTKCPENREQFWDDYYKFGFIYIAKKYANFSLNARIKRAAVILLKKFGLFQFIKNLVKRK
ncbi:Coenzyme F420 hydrogenase/dehydrogenase, beta subunit C-terminal domain [Clostridium sp. CM028]|uniref:Coenzyme F420 hydrogenase/dehydrogenase, beta subunit C-terminal domain n=1 Tax=Clostridium sp. CM028 TaxID=2851575 RepID=UPI001C6EF22B|nr:Coenzyme F420 hydrogenase/dehydrogenase, beta subunit C-terminal domain [Clostridium sp. CM028]MBW9148514.1 Coenzyme F420 hydrogenase/dehydrogenase, beta subunit C-terminal domain [Clostridium sp. CM028]WLC61084.1 Coenzyme F420 hydrogenase/dehydrogenase, beta subunit C-terminal domain [Clostridium sp. CM028]